MKKMHVNELPYILVGNTSCPREWQFTVSLYLYLQNKTEKKGSGRIRAGRSTMTKSSSNN